MESYEIRPGDEASSEAVHAGLRAYNRQFVADTADLSLAVTDETGRVIGGCDAFRMGELAMLDALWVAEDHRGAGLGSCILERLEAEAVRQGARRMEVNTLGFQAPAFYRKRGYRTIGVVEPAAGGCGHYFYVKEL